MKLEVTAATSSKVCENHPGRAGLAVCMACRKVVCQECATPWDGIHYCVGCLAARRRAETGRASFAAWLAVGAAVAGLFVLTAYLMVWMGVFLREIG